MEIHELKREDEKEWDEYVYNQPSSTFYHQIGWKKVIQRSYRHKPFYLLAREDGQIKGILPMFFMKNFFFGKKLVSLPFAPYGGVIGDNNVIEESLIYHAINITNKLDANYMELRNNISKDSKLINSTKYMTLMLKLDKDPELVWKGFSNKVRNAVRKSLKYNLEFSKCYVEEFYELYSKNMRDLGSPTHSKKFFNAVMSEFKEKAETIIVRHSGEPISTAMLLYFKDTIISGWAASDRKYNHLNPNNVLYWNKIETACKEGYKFFDFGRSIEDSGTYRFKKPWGAEDKHLQYEYYLNGIKHVPDTSQTNVNRKLFAKVWKNLPLSLTNIISPKLRGNIP